MSTLIPVPKSLGRSAWIDEAGYCRLYEDSSLLVCLVRRHSVGLLSVLHRSRSLEPRASQPLPVKTVRPDVFGNGRG